MSAKEKTWPVRQEEDRIRVWPVTLALVGATVFATLLVLWGGLELRRDQRERDRVGTPHGERVPLAPAAIGGIRQTLIDADTSTRARLAADRALLESGGWVDEGQGIARIPIELAMKAVILGASP